MRPAFTGCPVYRSQPSGAGSCKISDSCAVLGFATALPLCAAAPGHPTWQLLRLPTGPQDRDGQIAAQGRAWSPLRHRLPPPPPREVRAQVVSGFPSCFSSGCPGPCTALLSTSLLRAALRPDRIHGGSLAFSLSSMPPGPTQVCSAGCDDVGHAAAWHASRLLKLFPCLAGSLGPQPQHSCGSG